MLDIKISVGGSSVFATGTLIVQNDATIRMDPFGPGNLYFLELRFLQTGLSIPTFRNFNEGLGHVVVADSFNTNPSAISNRIPMYVANYMGRKLMALFSIEALGVDPLTRSVIYTLLDGGPAT